MRNRLKRKTENWRQKLPHPVRLRDGRVLATLGQCRDYLLNLDEGEAGLRHWQHAAKLMLEASTGGDLHEVQFQFERILTPQNKLALT